MIFLLAVNYFRKTVNLDVSLGFELKDIGNYLAEILFKYYIEKTFQFFATLLKQSSTTFMKNVFFMILSKILERQLWRNLFLPVVDLNLIENDLAHWFDFSLLLKHLGHLFLERDSWWLFFEVFGLKTSPYEPS